MVTGPSPGRGDGTSQGREGRELMDSMKEDGRPIDPVG
jgi:hypothetical protein